MGDVTTIRNQEVYDQLKQLLDDVQKGKVTYIEFLIQREDEEYVEWDLIESGVKSYDPQHLMAQIGYLYLGAQSVITELTEPEEENESYD